MTRNVVTNALAALQGLALLAGHRSTPTWLDDSTEVDPADIMATRSGLLVLPRIASGDCLLKPTAKYFSPNGVEYDYDPIAECPNWLAFLGSLWPDDLESIQALQDWIGYLLSPDARLHKLLMLIGPPRSGKGTIGRVIKQLIGENNLACPKLASFSGPFGLQPLLGKTAALITDARLSGRSDAIAIVENLLSISGEDPQDVHRKNMPTLTGIRLPVRFTIFTNELPNLRDASGALTSRVILLRMTRTFLGREDKSLDAKLKLELPGILNWALTGWYAVRDRGTLIQPESGRELLADLDDLASPIKQFIRECCIVGPEFSVRVSNLFETWTAWCKEHGRENVGTDGVFGKDLRSALPQVKRTQPRCGDLRVNHYEGIGIRADDSGTGWHQCQSILRDAEF
ncbi:MAG: phage/plasmid primase, P4 family [Planctomycetaceae bacterium]